MVAAKPLIAAIKMFNTARTNPLAWAITAQYLGSIDYSQRLEWLRAQYAVRCAFLLRCLTDYMPAGVHWSHPQGGYFVWLTLADNRDTEMLLRDALAAGVSFAPGKYFYAHGTEMQNQLRLSFSWLPPEDMERGIATLARVIALNG
jgi:2-aminoadipate transaminase